MAEYTNEISRDDLSAHWQDYDPAKGVAYEIGFDYHQKERLGRIEKIDGKNVTLQLYLDGNESFDPADKHFKTFTIANIESEIEVYKLS